jgi:hypothetical protein
MITINVITITTLFALVILVSFSSIVINKAVELFKKVLQ